MRFIQTKRFSPVIFMKDLPGKDDYFHKSFDTIDKDFLKEGNFIVDENWWRIQKERCIYGYDIPSAIEKGGDEYVDGVDAIWDGNDCYLKDLDLLIKNRTVHITGDHYFYLNFWKIKRLIKELGRKDISNPAFTSLSFDNFQVRDMMFRLKKDNMNCKARQKGFSEEEACVLGKKYLFLKNSQCVIVAGVEMYADNTMNMLLRGIERLKNTQFYEGPAKGGDRQDYLKSKHKRSEVYKKTAKGNSQAVSGLSPTYVLLEETGIWQRGLVRELTEFLNPSMQAEGIKTGYKVYVGTGGEMDDGVYDMKEMFYNPTAYNLLEFDNIYEESNTKIARFIPAWKFKIIDEDGNSLKEESIKVILKDRDSKSPAEKYRAITQEPLTPSELFMIPTGGYFGAHISQWCNERMAFIANHKEAQVEARYKGKWVNSKRWEDGVVFKPDVEGPFMISEKPETYKVKDANKEVIKDREGNIKLAIYENLYRAGTDSYDQDEARTSSSKGACWIKKGFLNGDHTYNKFVAGVVERPTEEQGGAEIFYEQVAMLCIAYNAINLIEHSKIRIFDFFKAKGLHNYLKLRPLMVTANWTDESKVSNRYGIDAATKPFWLKMLRDWLNIKDNIDQCDHPMLLDAWAKFRYSPSEARYNCDNTIASSLCEVVEQDEKELTIETEESKNKKYEFLSYRIVDGRIISNINNRNRYAYTN